MEEIQAKKTLSRINNLKLLLSSLIISMIFFILSTNYPITRSITEINMTPIYIEVGLIFIFIIVLGYERRYYNKIPQNICRKLDYAVWGTGNCRKV